MNKTSVQNEFDDAMYMIDEILDFFAIAETKTGQSFPGAQLTCTGYKRAFLLDITSKMEHF